MVVRAVGKSFFVTYDNASASIMRFINITFRYYTQLMLITIMTMDLLHRKNGPVILTPLQQQLSISRMDLLRAVQSFVSSPAVIRFAFSRSSHRTHSFLHPSVRHLICCERRSYPSQTLSERQWIALMSKCLRMA